MKLTEKHISDFQKLYFEEYKITLSEEDASERATKLVECLKTVLQPITKEDYVKYKIN